MNKTTLGILAYLTSSLLPFVTHAQETRQKPSFAIAANVIHITEDNVGFAVNYEHFLNQQRSISLYLPFSYSLPVTNTYYYKRAAEEYFQFDPQFRTYISPQEEWSHNKGMAYFYPGIKFYTGKKMSRVSYSVGASLLAGIGRAELATVMYNIDTLNQGGTQYLKRTVSGTTTRDVARTKIGILLTNSLNIRASSHIYTGIEMGLGYSYVNRQDGANLHRGVLAQIGLKLGYYR
ncbi:MAG: hypothetical protein JNL72_06650 [Flavipsychrobacter sp.]|nr:hypothetical protein [Flavipsychrobacter sp.]